jgi:hypothetical protein
LNREEEKWKSLVVNSRRSVCLAIIIIKWLFPSVHLKHSMIFRWLNMRFVFLLNVQFRNDFSCFQRAMRGKSREKENELFLSVRRRHAAMSVYRYVKIVKSSHLAAENVAVTFCHGGKVKVVTVRQDVADN